MTRSQRPAARPQSPAARQQRPAERQQLPAGRLQQPPLTYGSLNKGNAQLRLPAEKVPTTKAQGFDQGLPLSPKLAKGKKAFHAATPQFVIDAMTPVQQGPATHPGTLEANQAGKANEPDQ